MGGGHDYVGDKRRGRWAYLTLDAGLMRGRCFVTFVVDMTVGYVRSIAGSLITIVFLALDVYHVLRNAQFSKI
jgi:hypothetical protein